MAWVSKTTGLHGFCEVLYNSNGAGLLWGPLTILSEQGFREVLYDFKGSFGTQAKALQGLHLGHTTSFLDSSSVLFMRI